ncbi:Serine/threonine protein kinase [Nocardiopsis flavescens]|uniref:Serine/threonine protein kinase n=1 Tax=Nocardiopsis flavescens TaxID=758803 RepID=A0A1M6FW09_9ACTN|nr:Serine/threonine protein kinase [Nocardiopsis flavescens]
MTAAPWNRTRTDVPVNPPPPRPPGAPAGVSPLSQGDPRAVGPFRIAGRLGAGGMGTVYAALDDRDRRAALKRIHAVYAADGDFRDRFAREVRLVRRVRAEGVPRFLAADTRADVPWLATEYVPGPTLDARVRGGGPLPAGFLADFARVTARALAAIHAAGVVHRDLKPGNVILSPAGPRVLDFGIARAAEETALTRTGALVGTPGWISPEQYRGEAATDRSDVFAWACMAVFAATGRGPFGPGTEEGVISAVLSAAPALHGVPGPLRPVLAAALDKDPARRPSAAEAARALPAFPAPAPWAAVLPAVDADPLSWTRVAPPRRPWVRRHGRVLAVSAAATALAVAAATAPALVPTGTAADGGTVPGPSPDGGAALPPAAGADGEPVPDDVPEEYRGLYTDGTVVVEASDTEPVVVRSLVGEDGTALEQLRVTYLTADNPSNASTLSLGLRVEYLPDFGSLSLHAEDFGWVQAVSPDDESLDYRRPNTRGVLAELDPGSPEAETTVAFFGAPPGALYLLPAASLGEGRTAPLDTPGGVCYVRSSHDDEAAGPAFPGHDSLGPHDARLTDGRPLNSCAYDPAGT